MSRRATLPLAAEAAATGSWLGATQVALGFGLMASAGSSITLFLLFIATWLLGGALGATLMVDRLLTVLLGSAALAAAGARWALAAWPMSAAATVCGLGAGFVAGAYAGAYLRARAGEWDQVRRLLLHENNGFLVGYVAATASLFYSATVLELPLDALAAALLVAQALRGRPDAASRPPYAEPRA